MKNTLLGALILHLLIFPSKSILADALPVLPAHLASPFVGAQQHEMFSSAVDADRFFKNAGYDLEQVYTEQKVPQIYALNLPQDLNQLPVSEKTSLFIRLLLPSVIKANAGILAVRKELTIIKEKQQKGIALNGQEQKWLSNIATDHHGKPDQLQDLLARVDIIPESLIMAQAIDESGWGTSHFAIMGNALFGQHLSRDSQGSFLTSGDGKVRVATFDNLYHSTASYIHNLNSTKAYGRLRAERTQIRQQHGKLTGTQLAGALINYSARGQQYVDTLRWLIKHYQLDDFDNSRLDDYIDSTVIKFRR